MAFIFFAPADCPDPERFKAVVQQVFARHFSDDSHAAQCLTAWLQAQQVPQPFRANPDAASHYRQASMALSRAAQTWAAFEADANREFADYEDDGDRKDAAIPGWSPDWIALR